MVEQQSKPILWIVIPCYNEEEVLPETAPLFLAKLEDLGAQGHISGKSRVCFIDDGSTDGTWREINRLAASDPHFLGVSLAHNRGHQNALLCGLMEARKHCDAVISIDCDGQDDVNAMDQMVQNYLAGDDIVYGVRDNRDSDTAFKRGTAQAFYRLMAKLGAETVYNHADYRLMSKKALDALAECGEVNLFLRGMVPLIGLPHSEVTYTRNERVAGESHYPLRKMIGLALDGITSLSVQPIRLASMLGILFSIIGLIGIVWAVVAVVTGNAVAGWASTIVVVCLIGGIQLLSIGVIGEYIGKIYLESKRRPRYLVRERTWNRERRVYRG